jgi:hypothetical protein
VVVEENTFGKGGGTQGRELVPSIKEREQTNNKMDILLS